MSLSVRVTDLTPPPITTTTTTMVVAGETTVCSANVRTVSPMKCCTLTCLGLPLYRQHFQVTREGEKLHGWGGSMEEAAVNTVREDQYVETSVYLSVALSR